MKIVQFVALSFICTMGEHPLIVQWVIRSILHGVVWDGFTTSVTKIDFEKHGVASLRCFFVPFSDRK